MSDGSDYSFEYSDDEEEEEEDIDIENAYYTSKGSIDVGACGFLTD